MPPGDATRLSRLSRLPRDKADALLLLAAALAVLAPHFAHLPWWANATICATLLWRGALTWLGRRMPPLALLLPVSLAAMAGVYLSFHTLLGRDAGVAMLALLLAFKLLEMHARRDLFVVIFLSFFLLLTTFFYSQSVLTALSMLLTLVLLLAAQLSFQYTGAVPPLRTRLTRAARIVLLAAPLALLLFVGFPRIQGPLWGLPGDAHGGRTGMSDTMSPGSVSNLAQSDELAFRVRFIDPVPKQSQLYWRGIVLGDYDGRTWTQVPRRRGLQREQVAVAVRGRQVRHDITLEPTGKPWLFALELTGPELLIPGWRVLSSDELEFSLRQPVEQRLRYQATAWTDFSIDANRAPQQMRRWLELPAGFNPRTLALAGQLRGQLIGQPAGAQLTGNQAAGAQPGPETAAALADAVLRRFREQPYQYTLEPPALGRDAVDQFLFDTKAGFCEHYASAFVVLMRAAGVPARVVTGYQGGELNPVDGYLTVRQSDAHAWAEIWLAGQGWRRIDPTAAVAPERVATNLARALPRSAPFGLGALIALQNDPHSWLAQLRFNIAAVNNGWNQWVLDYNPDRQRGFLADVKDAFANRRSAGGAALALLLLALLLKVRTRARLAPDRLDALYHAFCRQQSRHGYARRPDEGPRDYGARLRDMPASADKHAAMARFLNLYGALKYGAATDSTTASLTTLTTLLPLCR